MEELFLRGRADLAYWQRALSLEGLLAVPCEGHALLQISALRARLGPFPFRELSFCVSAARPGYRDDANGLYLAHAYTGSRVVAWVERFWSSSPYYFGSIQLHSGAPASISLSTPDGARLQARLGAGGKATALEGPASEAGWEGTIFLPRSRRAPGAGRKVFAAKVEGTARSFRFRSETDSLSVRATRRQGALVALLESDFRVQEWGIRTNGSHSKSRTVAVA